MRSLLRIVALSLAITLPVAAAAETARPIASEVVTADRARQRSFAGVIEADVQSVLAFQTLGRIATLDVAAGDRVKKGEPLASLDQVTLKEDVEAAEAARAAAAASAAAAAQQLTRTEELSRRGVAAADQLELAQRGNDTAKAQLTAAEADLARAKDAEQFGTLTAPMDGIVLSTAVEAGTIVSAGTAILTLASSAGREAVIDVPVDYLALLSHGTTFVIQSRGANLPDQIGTLRLIEPVADASVRSRRIRVSLPTNAPAGFRIGSLVSARLAEGNAPIITLPVGAIVTGADGTASQVWRVDPAGRVVHLIPVVTGLAIGSRILIQSGIAPGDEIVVKGVNSLKDGETVGERLADE